MSLALPDCISAFFEISNSEGTPRLASCFTGDAVVRDEGNVHRGIHSIESWLRDARERYRYSVEPLSVTTLGVRIAVGARIAGNFSGSPVEVEHVFVLENGKIRSLDIG